MKRIATLVLLAFLLASASVSPVSANREKPEEPDTNTTTEIRPELGPTVEGLTPGVHGYKVFHPGSIQTVSVQPVNGEIKISNALKRRGYTEVWGRLTQAFGPWEFTGGHTSDSDIIETRIWADGYLKYQKDTSWKNSCSQRTSGYRAHCNTSFRGANYWPRNKAYAETLHHFHTSGYVNGNLKSLNTY